MPAPSPDSELTAKMVAIRRDLHQHPELSWAEHRTHDVVCRELEALGIAHRKNVVGTGVIAELPGPAGVPAVALRADTDALAIHEETGLPWASKTPGVMHACGHDGHTSMLLGAAALLSRRSDLPAPVRLIWQPAEEKVDGARALIAAGALEGVGCIFGGHLDRHYPAGTLVVTRGAVNASTDRFHVVIRGQDAHGARPHESVDAIVVGAHLVTALQTVVSRETDPAQPSVVTVGRFTAGTVHNAIAGVAELEGTIRAQHPGVRSHLKRRVEEMACAVAALHGSAAEVTIEPGAPPVINDETAFTHAHAAAVAVVGSRHVVPLVTANMGGEDFADYLDHVPGCYIRFGARVPGRESFPAHSSRFDFDEAAMESGARWFVQVARLAGTAMAASARG